MTAGAGAGPTETAESALLADVLARLDHARLERAVLAVTSVPSPTGAEAPLARTLVAAMARSGVESTVQHLDADQANALGRIRGTGTGPDLMLYAPIDTLTTGDPARDEPWAGLRLADHQLPVGVSDGRYVTGLGAGNPKGHAACVLEVGRAVAEALTARGTRPAGDLVLAFGAGGMPTNAVDPAADRANTGHGVGAGFLLERGWYTDAAVIAKPGDFVAHDEVGLCWFEVTVHGLHTYVGSRHRIPYDNPVVGAARLIVDLERWLADYPVRHRTATAAPQGVIGSVAGGWERMLAVTPAVARLRLDLRLAPGETPQQLKREVVGAIGHLSAELGLRADVELVNAIPASSTDPDDWIVRHTVRAWEQTHGRPHVPVPDNSGATDANILRARGVPTARVGMPKVPHALDDFSRGMNTVDVHAMRRLAEVLARVVVATVVDPVDDLDRSATHSSQEVPT